MKLKIALASLFFAASVSGKEALPIVPPAPLPADWKEISTDLVKRGVRDAESVRIEFRDEPFVMTCKKSTFTKGAVEQIYVVNVWVNGKNAYGGYVGFEPWSVAFTPGQNAAYHSPNGGGLSRFGFCKRA